MPKKLYGYLYVITRKWSQFKGIFIITHTTFIGGIQDWIRVIVQVSFIALSQSFLQVILYTNTVTGRKASSSNVIDRWKFWFMLQFNPCFFSNALAALGRTYVQISVIRMNIRTLDLSMPFLNSACLHSVTFTDMKWSFIGTMIVDDWREWYSFFCSKLCHKLNDQSCSSFEIFVMLTNYNGRMIFEIVFSVSLGEHELCTNVDWKRRTSEVTADFPFWT